MKQTVITKITQVDQVTLITLLGIPDDISYITAIFTQIAQADINIDMLSQSSSYGGNLSLSFTIDSNDLSKALSVISKLKKEIPALKTDVSDGNTKLIFYGEAMRDHSGVAAQVFQILKKHQVQPKLITSSEVDISILVDGSAFNILPLSFENEFH